MTACHRPLSIADEAIGLVEESVNLLSSSPGDRCHRYGARLPSCVVAIGTAQVLEGKVTVLAAGPSSTTSSSRAYITYYVFVAQVFLFPHPPSSLRCSAPAVPLRPLP